MQDAAGRVDAFLGKVHTLEARLVLASAALALAGAVQVRDAGGILSAVASVHDALKGVQQA
jgi:hypothetical protein